VLDLPPGLPGASVMRTQPAGASATAAATSRQFAGTPQEVGAARRWVQQLVCSLAGTDAADQARILTSELVTNAVMHSASGRPGGTVTVVVISDAAGIAVHVHDLGGPAVPRMRHSGETADGGRGLMIVAEVAAEWGTCPVAACSCQGVGGARCVWFRLALSAGVVTV
jgi:serine/threonine-protein kinase RsbW